MNYQKIDAPLAMALNQVDQPTVPQLVVFIHTQQPLEPSAINMLKNIGVSDTTTKNDVFTATLSPNCLSQLTDQQWVKAITLSQKLHFRQP